MRNLIVSCDGTWNTPDQNDDGLPTPTNVRRLHNLIRDGKFKQGETKQFKYYHPGVGTGGKWWERIMGGAFGLGLSKNIKSGYKWLCDHYQPGDRIFLFGFSRGAYTVRSLAGFITTCGLLDFSGIPAGGNREAAAWKRVDKAYEEGYRDGKKGSDWRDASWALHKDASGSEKIELHFLGVYDTVGALGVPDDMALLNLLDDPKRLEFHDTKLSDRVKIARHAVALDEMRASYAPTLWLEDSNKPHPDMKQTWFAGVHSDIGGGYPETGLSDTALQWMIEEAQDAGLLIDGRMHADYVHPKHDGVLHDSRRGAFEHLRTQPRSMPELASKPPKAVVHPAVTERQKHPPITQAPYRPSVRLKKGQSATFTIFAGEPWNATGLYVGAGEKYDFTASGEWMDGDSIKCGPGGTRDGKFQIGELVHVAASVGDMVERGFKFVTGNEAADIRGTRRENRIPWFALVGVIANSGNPKPDGTVPAHETFTIGDKCTHTVGKATKHRHAGGYLYCFANDAWHFYWNNRGSVEVRVRRVG